MTKYRIHPSIGIARAGNSTGPGSFYLAPTKIGGLPIDCDVWGKEETNEEDDFEHVRTFKDKKGRIRKQAAKFMVYRYDPANNREVEVDLTDKNEIKSVEWTVHLANKKAAWYEFSEYEGDTLFGKNNSYSQRKVPLRNSIVVGLERQKLIIDFGPRTLSEAHKSKMFSLRGTPKGYSSYQPHTASIGTTIASLGEIKTDSKKNLIVLGGSGNAGGNNPIAGITGTDTWHDDISDGPVTCKLTLKDSTKIILKAWVIVCSPKFAPQLRNISTLDDAVFDGYVRQFNLVPEMFDVHNTFHQNKINEKNEKISIRTKDPEHKHWNPDYRADFERDITPIIDRVGDYRWVANVPSIASFHWPSFDVKDKSDENEDNRQKYYKYFRDPGNLEKDYVGQRDKLFINGVPLMPQNSGSNTLSDTFVDKFATLTNTQYFLLGQWADGKFTTQTQSNSKKKKCKVCDAEFKGKKALRQHLRDHKGEYRLDSFGLNPLDRAHLGNCAGIPMCPGIEVTWNVKNKIIYDEESFENKDYFRIMHRTVDDVKDTITKYREFVDKKRYFDWDEEFIERNESHVDDYKDIEDCYLNSGLDPYRDETEGGGCEPGDLTKRMALPWHADMFECSIEYVSLKPHDNVNSVGMPTPPLYYAYWWPPQAPVHVIFGDDKEEEQKLAGIPAGMPVNYLRGINSHMQMIFGWSYTGFIVNKSNEPEYPYFVEKERNHEEFQVLSASIDRIQNVWNPNVEIFNPIWYLKRYKQTPTG